MGVSINGGTQQPWVFLLKMTILGCFGGTTILGNTQINGNLCLVGWVAIRSLGRYSSCLLGVESKDALSSHVGRTNRPPTVGSLDPNEYKGIIPEIWEEESKSYNLINCEFTTVQKRKKRLLHWKRTWGVHCHDHHGWKLSFFQPNMLPAWTGRSSLWN